MSSSPFLSIIIPSFNQGDFIQSTILSIIKQDYSDWELIIQDGGSTDSTENVCRQFEKQDNRIRFYREKDNGFADAVNKAIDKARGTIAAIQSSDDYYSHETVFSEVSEFFNTYKNLNIVTGYFVNVDVNHLGIKCSPPFQKQVNEFIEPKDLFSLSVHFPQSSTFFKLDRARFINKLNQQVDMVADTDFWIRMANYSPVKDKSIYRINKILSCVSIHESQRSVDQSLFLTGRAKMYLEYINDSRLDISDAIKLQSFYANLIDAIDHFLAEGKDIRELENLYTRGLQRTLPIRWKAKEILSKFAFIRKFLFGNNQNKSSLNLLTYPRGKSYAWFKDDMKSNSFTGT